MLSEEMYGLLKVIPRHGRISYIELKQKCGIEEKLLDDLLCEARYGTYDFINADLPLHKGSISLTEKGKAAIEEYEAMEENHKITKRALTVARIGMWAAIASAITAIISLVKMFF